MDLTSQGEISALAVANVGYAFGKHQALRNVSFAVPAGSFAVLLGLNGAGKSTLFALITRLYATQTGRISVFGFDVNRRAREALMRLGVVFQSRTLDPDLSVLQNLVYHAALHGIGRGEARRRIDHVLHQVALDDRAHAKVRTLSGGQMRRVEIARALLHRPQLLLLDEATVGLDVKSRAEILHHVRDLVAREHVGVLWATHLIDEVSNDDIVVVLHQGQVLAHDTARRILASTGAADMRQAFVGLTGVDAGRISIKTAAP